MGNEQEYTIGQLFQILNEKTDTLKDSILRHNVLSDPAKCYDGFGINVAMKAADVIDAVIFMLRALGINEADEEQAAVLRRCEEEM